VLNKIWSILAKGTILTPSTYNRKVDQDAYLQNVDVLGVLNILIPYGDILYRSFHIEDCTHLLLISDIREQALTFDPINTYEKSTLIYPTPGEFVDTLSSGRVEFFTDPGAQQALGEGDIQIKCDVDPVAFTLTTKDGVFDYILSNNQSSEIELRTGLKIRLYGTLPVGDFSFTVSYIDKPFIEWGTILSNLETLDDLGWQDESLKEIWDTDVNWVNRIAAVALNTIQESAR